MQGSILKRTIEEAILFLKRKNVVRQEDTISTMRFVLTARSHFL